MKWQIFGPKLTDEMENSGRQITAGPWAERLFELLRVLTGLKEPGESAEVPELGRAVERRLGMMMAASREAAASEEEKVAWTAQVAAELPKTVLRRGAAMEGVAKRRVVAERVLLGGGDVLGRDEQDEGAQAAAGRAAVAAKETAMAVVADVEAVPFAAEQAGGYVFYSGAAADGQSPVRRAGEPVFAGEPGGRAYEAGDDVWRPEVLVRGERSDGVRHEEDMAVLCDMVAGKLCESIDIYLQSVGMGGLRG